MSFVDTYPPLGVQNAALTRGWNPTDTPYVNQLTLHDIREYGGFATDNTLKTDTIPAFNAAIAALSSGQDLFLPFDPAGVGSDGICTYWIATPIELTKEINIVFESKMVAIKLISNAGWGTLYFHAIRNWQHTDYGGAVPTENRLQAPDITAFPTFHHNIHALDGMGGRIHLNGQDNVSAASFVHLHEMSYISLVTSTGSSSSGAYHWGMVHASLFCNNDGNGQTAGPIYIERPTAYGQGYDHMMYVDGSNGGTTTNFVQDLRYVQGCTMPLTTTGDYKQCIKSPWRHQQVNGVSFQQTHTEANPHNAPPTVGAGAWPGAGATVEQGTKIITKSVSGANTGLASYWCATTGGVAGGAEPAWPTDVANATTVADGTVVWHSIVMSTGNLLGNSTRGILDGCLSWPGSSIAVDKGTTISPDGTHGWVCTTAGTTNAGASPAFSTAGGRGSTQADGTCVWTYATDSFDSAIFRWIDCAYVSLVVPRVAASTPSNRPISRATLTGSEPSNIYVNNLIDIYAMQLIFGSTGVIGLTNCAKDGWMGLLIDHQTLTIPYSYVRCDPRLIESLNSYDMIFLHTKALTPTRRTIATPATGYRQAQTLTPSAVINTNGVAVPFTLDTGMVSVRLRGNYGNAVGPAGGEQLTCTITVTYSDASTLAQTMTATTAGSTAVVNGTVNGIGANFYKDGLYITGISAVVKSNQALSAATFSLTLFGDNVP